MIMRDVNSGWALRYIHSNVASFFFIFVYAQFWNVNIKDLLDYQQLYTLIYKHKYIDYIKHKIIDDFINMIKTKNSTSLSKDSISKIDNDNNFIQWFVGFSDAEGDFMINTKNNKEIHFVFQITLHVDDVGVLYTIRDQVGIGIVSTKFNTSSFCVHSFKVIVESLLPMFYQYPLITHKQLNYIDWRKAIMLKKLAQNKKKK